MNTGASRLLGMEINFVHEGERWITRLGNYDRRPTIGIRLDDDPLHKIADQLTPQLLQHGVKIKAIRRAVFGGPLAILLDRIIAVQAKTRRTAE